MIKKVSRSNIRDKLYWQNYLKVFTKKSLFVLTIILILLLLKKMNFNKTNKILEVIKTNINYEFNLVQDGKKAYTKTISFLDNSLDSIWVFNDSSIKLDSPLAGTVYKKFNQEVKFNETIVKNNGLDIKSISEVDPKAIIEGVVTNVEFKGNKGYFVTINNDNMDIIYGYLSKSYVSSGSTINEGDLIGLLGTNKDGNKYLRLEIYINGIAVDPMDYIDI